jgi:hypothetical protein
MNPKLGMLGTVASKQAHVILNVIYPKLMARKDTVLQSSIRRRRGGAPVQIKNEAAGNPHGMPGILYQYPSDKMTPNDYHPPPYTLCFASSSKSVRVDPAATVSNHSGHFDIPAWVDWQGFVYDSEARPFLVGVVENTVSRPGNPNKLGPSNRGTAIRGGVVTLHAPTGLPPHIGEFRLGDRVGWMPPAQVRNHSGFCACAYQLTASVCVCVSTTNLLPMASREPSESARGKPSRSMATRPITPTAYWHTRWS